MTTRLAHVALALLAVALLEKAMLLKTCCGATNEPPASTAAGPDSLSARVDRTLADEVFAKRTDVKLAPTTGDEAFLRRATLDLVGELPTPSEITLFALDPSPDKRARLVDRLLADPRYGRNWARYWRDVIMYRRVEDRALIAARPLEQYLADQFNRNVGWDNVARDLIEAKGNVAEEGPTALLLAQGVDPNDVASETSRIFLGIQIQCAQCHDHPTDRWKREQFHEFAAFFPRVGIRQIFQNGQTRGFEIVSTDNAPLYRGAGGQGRGAREHYMPDLKNPTAQGKLMTPVFFATGQRLKTGVTDDERRGQLGDWLTARGDGWFAKALVNRLWSELVGEAFCEPVDDLGPERACSAPHTLDLLAKEFAAHGYDLKWLLRTITATAAYQRESRPRRLPDQVPFAANCAQRLRSDQVYDNLLAVVGSMSGQANVGSGGPLERLTAAPRARFGLLFGYDPSVPRNEVSGSIPQALALMNSPALAAAINGTKRELPLGKLLASTTDDEQAIVDLYLRTLAREPTDKELTVAKDYVHSVSSRAEAFEDLLWALINQTEFLLRN